MDDTRSTLIERSLATNQKQYGQSSFFFCDFVKGAKKGKKKYCKTVFCTL